MSEFEDLLGQVTCKKMTRKEIKSIASDLLEYHNDLILKMREQEEIKKIQDRIRLKEIRAADKIKMQAFYKENPHLAPVDRRFKKKDT